MSLEISSENQQFLDAVVASGEFQSRDAVINRAVTMLRLRQQAIEQILMNAVKMPELPESLEERPNQNIVIRGHRISLFLILHRHFSGSSEAELREWFPSISSEKMAAVLNFVRAHEDTMRAYFAQQQRIEDIILDNAHRGPTLAELRERWRQKFGKPFVSSCP